MTLWDALRSMFVEDLAGSHVLTTILFLMVVWGLLFLIRASKEVFLGVTSLFVYFLIPQGLIPAWVFFIILTLAGVTIGAGLVKIFFSGDG